jgi:hypothetical protein
MKPDTLKRLRDGLHNHYGALAEVVRRTEKLKDGGFTRNYVQQVLLGKHENFDILDIAVVVLSEKETTRRQRVERLEQRVNSILQPS